ncbi:MAG TPA: hypothetical protein VK041_11175, partial [Opitutales bacterium]|nr:hypothetical protein [Opitutales bacterium]
MHHWKFFRTGGLTQVSLESADDLLNLRNLDKKLWVALSCPVKGLEIDEKTLGLIDLDEDGRVRVPEVLAAVEWAAKRLKDPGELLLGADSLPLNSIDDSTPAGETLVASARQILASLDKEGAETISPAESSDTAKIFASSPLNGDGSIPPKASDDPAIQALIQDVILTQGGTMGRCGNEGVTAAQIETFFSELQEYMNWVEESAERDIAVLGESTDAALTALKNVRAKVDDFFARCRLAAFDDRATGALNRSESAYMEVAAKDLKITVEEVAAFPLAKINGNHELPLTEGVNPAWISGIQALRELVVEPLLGSDKETLTEEEWISLNADFAPYETWLGSKTGVSVEQLGVERIREILKSDGREKLDELVARDKALEPEFTAISDVDRLVHYYRDLRLLLHNFVNFADFYSNDRMAVFQSGRLFFDSRSTELCMVVNGPSPLAAMSKMYIVYMDCKREGETMKIAACITQGDSDYLFVGRNGVFYDRKGRDWDATVTSIVDSPISIRQAFFSPYKKFVRMIEEQVAKRAAAADAASSEKLQKAAEATTGTDEGGAATPVLFGMPARRIDVGTVAALGVAVGAIGGALATLATGIARLSLWQVPLVVLGLILLISLPSMVIAAIKLRQRTLGPLLEANGWAINGRVRISILFGRKLTAISKLPAGSKRSFRDPYKDRSKSRKR